MFCWWCCVVQGTTEDVMYEEFPNQPGIYLEEISQASLTSNNWKMILHFNLTNYWQEWDHINTNVGQMIEWCNHTTLTCTVLTQSVQLLVEGIKERNQVLGRFHRKKRAPLEFMGTLMSDLFGVMDQRDAEKYEQQIRALQSGTMSMEELIRKQTNVLDVTSNLIQKQHEQIMAQYKATQLNILELRQHNDFVDTILQLTININTFKEMQEALIDVIIDLHQGHINTQLITPNQLKEQLENLRRWAPENVRVPDYQHHWAQLYKMLRVQVRMLNELVIFELKVPLMEQQIFQIYRVHPVPILHTGQMVYLKPTSPWLLVDLQRIWYYPMQSEELSQCQRWNQSQLVCTQQGPLYTAQTDQQPCELSLLKHQSEPLKNCQIHSTLRSTTVIPLAQANQWVISLPEKETVDIICKNNLKHIIIQGCGILKLTPGCQLKTKDFLLQSQETYVTEGTVSFLPSFNLTKWIGQESLPLLIDDMDNDMEQLSVAIKKIHERESWTSLNLHDLHHYSSSVIMLIIIAFLVVAWWRRRQLCKLLFHLRREPAQHQNRATQHFQPPRQRRISC